MILLFYVLQIIEAALVYGLLKILLHMVGIPIPPFGSGVFILFVLLWPSIIAPFLRPGLQKIPLIGDLLKIVPLIWFDRCGTGRRDVRGPRHEYIGVSGEKCPSRPRQISGS